MRASVNVLIVCAVGACGGGATGTKRTDVASSLPSLTLSNLAGGTWTSDSARGRVLVIDVWATWCKPCSKGFPKLDALATRHPGVAVVAITIDEDLAAVRAFLTEFPLAVTVAQDVEKVLTRPPLSIARLPAILIVDPAGTIRHRLDEPSEHDYDQLQALIARLGN